ncbi:MAG: DNA/RNA nuclease SfsA, partial [Bdellovibrio sp.]
MQFKEKLHQGFFKKRERRFFAHIDCPGQGELVAHLPNTGSLRNVLSEGNPCWFSRSTNPERKLPWTLEAVQVEGRWVGVHSGQANTLVAESLAEIFPGSRLCQREPIWNPGTRFDFLIEDKDLRKIYVEVKSVSLANDPGLRPELASSVALFPDTVTQRGQKHLRELMEVLKSGSRACLIFVVQREGASAFSIARTLDSRYAELFLEALRAGLEVKVFPVLFEDTEFRLCLQE